MIDISMRNGFSRARGVTETAARGAVWVAAEMVFLQGLSLLVFSVVARFVTPVDLGIINICYVVIFSTKGIIFDVLASYLVRKPDITMDDYNTVFWTMVILGAISTIGMYFGIQVICWLLTKPELGPPAEAMSAILFFISLSRTHEAWLSRNFNFRSLAIRGTIGALAGGGVGIGAAYQGYGINALVLQQVISSLFSIILMWYITPWVPHLTFKMNIFVDSGKFILVYLGSAISSVITQNLDIAAITYIYGLRTSGLYAIAKRLKLALQLVASVPIQAVVLPLFAEALRTKELEKALYVSIMIVSATSIPVYMGASALSASAIELLFGRTWLEAAPFFSVLSISCIPIALITLVDNALMAVDKPKLSVFSNLSVVGILIVGLFIIPRENDLFAAWLFAAPYFLALPFLVISSRHLLRVRLRKWIKAVLPCIVSAGAMFATVRAVEAQMAHSGAVARVVTLTVIGTAVYSFLLALLSKDHAQVVVEGVKRIFARPNMIP